VISLCQNRAGLGVVQAFEQRAQLRGQLFEWRKVRRQRLSYGAADNLFQFGAIRQIVQLGVASRPIIILWHGVEFPIPCTDTSLKGKTKELGGRSCRAWLIRETSRVFEGCAEKRAILNADQFEAGSVPNGKRPPGSAAS
jgi:hypothetical protein